ncbi:FAD-dependent monooxygenase [Brachybacterium tyrofermentans]|uniref:FAD-dependent monooxygenase n=1 Tax=Brachybacterium tyrofermentans TaxID=47848 RepID=UPI003FD23130
MTTPPASTPPATTTSALSPPSATATDREPASAADRESASAAERESVTAPAGEPATAAETDLPLLETDVLVVGAGPTGLMAALVLARRGVSTLVIDSKAGPTRESRAIVVQARSMEIYDQLGLAREVIDGAVPAQGIQIRAESTSGGLRSRASGVDIERMQAGRTPFPGVQIFEQSRNEELLARVLADEGHPVLWRHGLDSLGASPGEPVEALVTSPEGPMRIRARWCIGADGASSTVRHELGLSFDGITDDATFCVADLHGVTGLPDNALAARFGDEKFAILFPLGPGGHVRLIWLHGDEHPEQETALAEARADLGIDYDRADWFSAYRVHHRIAPSFRQGAAFLAGDAGHVHSPLGGQGMNTGLQDAHHLANLLADVASGHCTEAALDRYDGERRPVAATLISATDRAFGLIARPGRGAAFLRRRARDVMAELVPRLLDTRLGPYAGGLLGQYRIRYHPVPAEAPVPLRAADPAVGLRLPPTAENAEALRALTWQLHTYGADAARPASIPAWVEGPFAFSPDVHGRLRTDRLYLVRPDGFVAASFPVHAGAAAMHAVRTALADCDLIT